MSKLLRSTAAAIGLALAVGACQDLTVPNPNDPDIDRILLDPSDVESLVGSSWRPYWNYTNGLSDNTLALTTIADEFTATAANVGMLDLSSEPRRPFNNDPAYANRFVNQGPWYSWYGAISNANAGLRFVNGVGRPGQRIVVEGRDRTARVNAFARFMQGLLHGYYAMYYDRAYIVTEGTDLASESVVAGLELKPYTEVRDTAVASLRQAATLAAAMAPNDTIPNTWIPGVTMNRAEFAQLINSYLARTIVYNARTPQEAQQIDWNAVIAAVDAGIRVDHAPGGPLGNNTVLTSSYKRFPSQSVNSLAGQRACDGGTTIQLRTDYRLIGPADTTGAYQAWIAAPVDQRTRFTMRTPDRRIEGAAAPVNNVPANGSYFRFCTGDGTFNAARGTYHFSAYQWNRFASRWDNGPLPNMTVAEMDLIKAEALLRLNRPAEAAVLINRTRVANGQLPPVTADGVPQSGGCVPRKDSGACGDLWDALMYEKGIEGAGIESVVRWVDMRRWGRLVPGTPLHFPVPGRELAVIGEAIYTFGGSGPGSAP